MRNLFTVLLFIVLLSTSVASLASASPPTIKRPMEVIQAGIESGAPETVDPAWSYDTASAELIMQVYDTLIVFDGERVDSYLPALATDWTAENITGETSPEGLDWHYRYTFEIRAGVQWHDPTYGTVAPADVEYSIERAMVQDRAGGPQWMLYEPLLDSWGADGLGYDLSIPAEASTVGQMIDHAVESNATHVWFNLAFPGAYAPLMQILSQTWGSILCQAWIQTEVITNLGRPDWDGVWGDYTGWVAYNKPTISPLDNSTPVMMGCGPFEYGILDYTLEQWDVSRFMDYWRGWPIDYPSHLGVEPEGYIDHFVVTWAYEWPIREALFLAGDVDYCAVPSIYTDSIVDQDGIRCTYPLYSLTVNALFFTFSIDPVTSYNNVYPAGEFHQDGIPTDFFGNSTWGVHLRKAFAYCFDYDNYTSTYYSGEFIQPSTAIIPGLPYYDPTVPKYTFDLAKAEIEFKSVPDLWNTGFTMNLLYMQSSLPRQVWAELLKTAIEAMNPKFHVNLFGMSWMDLLSAIINHEAAVFTIGWFADYPDPHNFAFGFYCSDGWFAPMQRYSAPAMDALIEAGIAAPDGPEREVIYRTIQQLAISDCPSVTIMQPICYHFERDWMQGWYYNPVYPGLYAANLWKWYYVEEALQPAAVQPYSGQLPVDVNYEGKVDMKDISTAAYSFGALHGPPIHPRWNFRVDINCDRKIDMKDIGLIAKNYGQNSTVWTPP